MCVCVFRLVLCVCVCVCVCVPFGAVGMCLLSITINPGLLL